MPQEMALQQCTDRRHSSDSVDKGKRTFITLGDVVDLGGVEESEGQL